MRGLAAPAGGRVNAQLAEVSAESRMRTLLQKHRGDRDAAIEEAIIQCSSDPVFAAQAQRRGLETFAANAVSASVASLIRAVAPGGDSGARVRSAFESSFLITYQVLGKPLGKCTDGDLRRSIASRKANADTELKKASFETAVLKHCKKGELVEKCMSEEDIRDLSRRHL